MLKFQFQVSIEKLLTHKMNCLWQPLEFRGAKPIYQNELFLVLLMFYFKRQKDYNKLNLSMIHERYTYNREDALL